MTVRLYVFTAVALDRYGNAVFVVFRAASRWRANRCGTCPDICTKWRYCDAARYTPMRNENVAYEVRAKSVGLSQFRVRLFIVRYCPLCTLCTGPSASATAGSTSPVSICCFSASVSAMFSDLHHNYKSRFQLLLRG